MSKKIIKNETGIFLPLAVWLASDDYRIDSRENLISATSMLKPIRQIVLGRKYKDSTITLDVKDFISSSMGTAIHHSVEKVWNNKEKVVEILDSMGYMNSEAIYDGVILERRSEMEIDGIIVSGQFDICFGGYVADIKSTSVWSYIFSSKDEDYIKQMSIYRLLNQDVITQDKCYVAFIFTDWSQTKAMQDSSYPQSRLITKELTLMSLEDTMKMLQDKIAEIHKYMALPDDKLLECPDEELWREAEVWKYYKPNAKTGKLNMSKATRNFKNKKDADEAERKDGGLVVHHKGKVKRCKYCNYTELCEQYTELKIKGLVE